MNLLKTLLTISGMTMLSRITGLIRELLIARAFGASGFTDAFFVAFRIPNLLRRLFAEGAFSQAFVPILGEYSQTKGKDETHELVTKTATALTGVLMLVCAVGVIAAPLVVMVVATGLNGDSDVFSLSVLMTRIMFPYIFFMSLVALAAGVLNTFGKFRVPAFTPVLLNLSFISCILFLAPYLEQPVLALAYAVFLGGLLQLGFQVPALMKIGMMPKISFAFVSAFRHEGVRRIIKQMLPATFAVSVAQVSLIINTNIASHLSSGSVSWISYADRLMEFPNAILGVALGTVLLPSLSKAHASGNEGEYSELLDWGLRLTFLLALPASVMLILLPVPFTTVLFHYGKFSSADVLMTSQALVAYGVGLTGLIVVRILAPGFYARQDLKTPVKIALAVLVLTQVLNVAFVPFIAHAGLALSIGLAACANALILYVLLRRRGIYTPQPGWLRFFVRVLVALVLLCGVCFFFAGFFDWIAMQDKPMARIAACAGTMVACGIVYFGTLFAMGFRVRDFIRRTK